MKNLIMDIGRSPFVCRASCPSILPLFVAAFIGLTTLAGSLRAEDKVDAGAVISDANTPIVGDLMRRLEGPLKRYDAERQRAPDKVGAFRLIYDFNPEGKANSSANYPACLTLTEDLLKLQKAYGVQTIGYVHGEVSRHSALPLLACSMIVFSEDGKIGKVIDDKAPPLPQDQRFKYDELVGRRLPLKKLYDARLSVIRVEKTVKGETQVSYHDAQEKNVPAGQVEDELKAGTLTEFDVEAARKYGIRADEPTLKTLTDVLNRYLPERRLRFTSSDHGTVRRIIVTGVITNTSKEELRDQIKTALAQRASFLIVQIDCGDGDSQAAYEMGKSLAEINEGRESKVETLAYLTADARNTAAFLMFGCERIALQPKGAIMKDFDRYVAANPTLENVLRDNLADLAKRQGHSEDLARDS